MDLPNIALLAVPRPLDAKRLRAALELTFSFRKTHLLPAKLPMPPVEWETPCAAMAREDQLPWPTLSDVAEAASRLLDPVLAGGMDAVWDAGVGAGMAVAGVSVERRAVIIVRAA